MDIKELFKTLVKAYYEDNFEATVNNLLIEQNENKENVSNIISALCGVELTNESDEYSKELKNAIFNYTSNNKIVIRIKDCNLGCMTLSEKTTCQQACEFDAISVDVKTCKVYIDNNKCTGCGFCVDACPNNCYMDKVEFLPLAKLLDEKNLYS
jgi:Na+-translocating ferredoxin:NAD+ oxidoreductase RNF subunit RnfB